MAKGTTEETMGKGLLSRIITYSRRNSRRLWCFGELRNVHFRQLRSRVRWGGIAAAVARRLDCDNPVDPKGGLS